MGDYICLTCAKKRGVAVPFSWAEANNHQGAHPNHVIKGDSMTTEQRANQFQRVYFRKPQSMRAKKAKNKMAVWAVIVLVLMAVYAITNTVCEAIPEMQRIIEAKYGAVGK